MESFALKYIGPKKYLSIKLSNKKVVIFNEENNYTYIPENFDEIYEILKIDDDIKFKLDSNSNISRRRVTVDLADKIIFDDDFVLYNEYTLLKQKEAELSKSLHKQFEDSYNFKIASGIIKSKPKDYNKLLEDFIKEGLRKEIDCIDYLDSFENFKKFKLSNKKNNMEPTIEKIEELNSIKENDNNFNNTEVIDNTVENSQSEIKSINLDDNLGLIDK